MRGVSDDGKEGASPMTHKSLGRRNSTVTVGLDEATYATSERHVCWFASE